MVIKSPEITALSTGTEEAIAHFQGALANGRSWSHAVLEGISLWTAPEEEFQGRHFKYLLDGEALDWLLLAERLCLAAPEYISDEERERLLFTGRLPDALAGEEFKALIGTAKYGACLSFWYGVVVEEALQEAVEEEIEKDRRSRGRRDHRDISVNAFIFIYNASEKDLLGEFRTGRGTPQSKTINLTERKEFTYWLFKYRVRKQEPARIASDTRKGLERLHTNFGIAPWES
jgi:hypothetical protein